MSAAPEQELHSYETFAQRPFYRAMDLLTIARAPLSRSVLDMATGTGAMIALLKEERKLQSDGRIIGIDIDPSAIEAAAKKFPESSIEFRMARAEDLPFPSEAFDLVVFCNAVHLTDMPKALTEACRVLQPGGTLILNSAYVKDVAYGRGGSMQWGRLVLKAQRRAREHGFSPHAPIDLMKHTQADYEQVLEHLEFSSIDVHTEEARMDVDDVRAICGYDEFATGAMPGVLARDSVAILQSTAEELFADMSKRNPGTTPTFPRGWMILSATK